MSFRPPAVIKNAIYIVYFYEISFCVVISIFLFPLRGLIRIDSCDRERSQTVSIKIAKMRMEFKERLTRLPTGFFFRV